MNPLLFLFICFTQYFGFASSGNVTTFSGKVPASLCAVYRNFDASKLGWPIKKPVDGIEGPNNASASTGSSCTQIRWDPQGSNGMRFTILTNACAANSRNQTYAAAGTPCTDGYPLMANGSRLWPGQRIYWKFGDGLDASQKASINTARYHVDAQTCLSFHECKKAESADCIIFQPGCDYNTAEPPGRKGGDQIVQLAGAKCKDVDYVVQKIMKAVGMGWAHNRPDRDFHIRIAWDKLPESNPNRRLLCRSQEDITLYANIPYEHKSAMHFNDYDAGKDTIDHARCHGKFGHDRDWPLKPTDVYIVHKMYGCAT